MPALTLEDKKLLQRCLSDNPQLKAVFDRLVASIAPVLSRIRESNNGIWINNRDVQRQVEKQLRLFAAELTAHINSQTEWAWSLSNAKNDAMVLAYIKGLSIPTTLKAKFLNRNIEALTAFQKRKIGGLTLSDRVWSITEHTQTVITTYLENGLSTGRSAAEISRDIRGYLNKPDDLFRRVRTEGGKLVPSRAMKANTPGTGVYNSAYQNALRLTATETNMAYRNADHKRWNNIDFITGYEVVLSGVHKTRMPGGDICDELQGRYPKDFTFTGWHPRCFCQAIAIKLNKDQFKQYLEHKANGNTEAANAIVEGSKVVGVEPKVSEYVKVNTDKFRSWKSEPYWLKDNFKYDEKRGYLPK